MCDQRIAIILLACLGVASSFMPWVKIPILGHQIGTEYTGWLTLALFIIPFVISFLGQTSRLLKGVKLYIALLASLIAAGIGIWQIIDLDSGLTTVEYGLYLMVISGLVIPLAAYIIGDGKANVKDHSAGSTSFDTEVMKRGAPD
ncbi:hypothetical protein [Salinimicrobium soli]|uniref:hypothetical protein n=1 Tax=Salinimicrobium soli TaxID=1254399 RepID=UPI003AAB6AB1